MDKAAILKRVLKKIPLENAVEIIKEKCEGWSPSKKPRKKDDIREKFVSIAEIIKDEEIEDFVQMAVMKKSVGLPTYTYKISDGDFLAGMDQAAFKNAFEKPNQPFNDVFTVTSELTSFSEEMIEMNFRLKEYDASWKTGIRNINSLSAVYSCRLSMNRKRGIVTLYCGNHSVQEVLMGYIRTVSKWPIIPYRIRENFNQIIDIGNVSYKSAVLLDLINNRLPNKGINSTLKEMKFFTGNKINKDGIKNVAIGGKALLASQLACEYIMLGSNIIYFKAGMNYEGAEFTAKIYLKGQELDILKVVILDTEDDDVRMKAVRFIQEEYIDMCNIGIKDMDNTKKLISSIADRFLKKDQLTTRAIKENTLISVAAICNLLDNMDENDPKINENLKVFSESCTIILDSIGFKEEDINLEQLNSFIQFNDVQVVDEDDYEDIDDEVNS